jgi:hypothetical protein
MHIAFKLNVVPYNESNAFTPFHNIYNYSMRGSKYMSIVANVTDSLPRIIRPNIKK